MCWYYLLCHYYSVVLKLNSQYLIGHKLIKPVSIVTCVECEWYVEQNFMKMKIMGKAKLLRSVTKLLNVRKFAFLYPLLTGIQIYGLLSFISSILIADVLLTKVIDQQICAEWRTVRMQIAHMSTHMNTYNYSQHHKTDLLSSIQTQVHIQLQCLSTKQIVLSQACQAFISALLLFYVKRASVVLCWVGCKFVVSMMEFNYLLESCRDFFIQFFSLHLHLAWFAVIFICVYAYGVLVAISYYAELTGNQASYNFSSKEAETNVDIPVPPDLPNF